MAVRLFRVKLDLHKALAEVSIIDLGVLLSVIEDVALRTALTEHDVDLRETVQRIDARRTGFPALVYFLLRPGEMVE